MFFILSIFMFFDFSFFDFLPGGAGPAFDFFNVVSHFSCFFDFLILLLIFHFFADFCISPFFYLEHEAKIQEGVMNFHLCLSIPINSL